MYQNVFIHIHHVHYGQSCGLIQTHCCASEGYGPGGAALIVTDSGTLPDLFMCHVISDVQLCFCVPLAGFILLALQVYELY